MGALRLRVLGTPLRASISVGIVTFAAGTGVGFLLGRHQKAKAEVHEIPSDIGLDLKVEDIDKLRARNIAKQKKGTVVIPAKKPELTTDVGKEFLKKTIQEVEASVIEEPTPEVETIVEVVTHSVFAASDDGSWQYEAELARRSPDEPYIIHKDEFFSNEFDYSQSTVTYFAGDNILADEDETPIYNHAGVVGEIRFGHGSGDKNVVYIRNDKRKAEYEVLFDPGLFSEEILGLEIEKNERKQELEHSNHRKFRME